MLTCKIYKKKFQVQRKPPIHMPICVGPVKSKKIKKLDELSSQNESDTTFYYCFICKDLIESGKELKCLNSNCDLVSHIICLSKCYLSTGQYVPVDGNCPKCKNNFLWGEIIRKYKGCYGKVKTNEYSSDSDE